MNLADIIIIAIIAVALFFAIRSIVKGKGKCSCGCSGCNRSCNCCNKK